MSDQNPTLCNNKLFGPSIVLKHMDNFSIMDRKFRFEFDPAVVAAKVPQKSDVNHKLSSLNKVCQATLLVWSAFVRFIALSRIMLFILMPLYSNLIAFLFVDSTWE